MSRELTRLADELGREKGIPRHVLAKALETAVLAATARRIGKDLEPEVGVDLDRCELNIKIPKEVTETDVSNWDEVTIEEASKFTEDPQLGDVIMVPIQLEDLGRQSAVIARQTLLGELRKAEKTVINEEFEPKKGEIISGTVLKTEENHIVINVGRTEAFLHRRDMIPGEFNEYKRGAPIRALLCEVRLFKDWPQLFLSRVNKEFLIKLFEAEIPEVFDGTIQIKAAARDPGRRAKIAVYTTVSGFDPVGACIGVKGTRINAISKELQGEKIDVIEWSNDPIKFVCNAISPAKVVLVNVSDNLGIEENKKTMQIVVPNDHKPLAIGKDGQNVRLAGILTDYRLDIHNETEYNESRKMLIHQQEEKLKKLYENNLNNLDELTQEQLWKLREHAIDDLYKLSNAQYSNVATILDISEDDAFGLVNSATVYLESKLQDENEENINETGQ
jgi:N utilization substance protein A